MMKLIIKNGETLSVRMAIIAGLLSIVLILFLASLGAGVLMVAVNFFCGMFAIPFILSYLQSLSLVSVLWILKNII